MPSKSSHGVRLYLTLGVFAAGGLAIGYFAFSGASPSRAGLSTPASSARPALAGANAAGASKQPGGSPAASTAPGSSGNALSPPPDPSETLSAFDPGQALVEASREADPELRRKRILAILRAWAAIEPDAAARAALEWPADDRVEPIAAVLAGVATRKSDDALRLGALFCREDPDWAPEHGRALITELSKAGAFSAAVSFALAGGNTVDGEERNKWLGAAFAGWAQREPQLAALAAANDLPETGMQQEALITVVAHWRRLNPDGPEKFLAQLPAGTERTALATALAATTPAER
jgi:hypothetical protein